MSGKTRRVLVVVCAVAAAGMVIFAAGFMRDAYRWSRVLARAGEARPLKLEADLSKPGRYEGELDQTFSASREQLLVIETSPPFASEDDALAAVGGLDGRFRVEDSEGSVMLEAGLIKEAVTFRQGPVGAVECVLARFHPFREGRYYVLLTVVTGAEGLAGRRHSVRTPYELGGIEYLSVTVGYGAGGICILVGLALGFVAWRLSRQRQSTRG